jgi:hypothetical protein
MMCSPCNKEVQRAVREAISDSRMIDLSCHVKRAGSAGAAT